MLSGFKFFEATEMALAQGLSLEDAAKMAAETKKELEAYKKASERRERRKRPAQATTSLTSTNPHPDPSEHGTSEEEVEREHGAQSPEPRKFIL
jgi:hypothetical protein